MRMHDVRGMRGMHDVRDIRDIRDARDVRDMRDMRDMRDTRDARDPRHRSKEYPPLPPPVYNNRFAPQHIDARAPPHIVDARRYHDRHPIEPRDTRIERREIPAKYNTTIITSTRYDLNFILIFFKNDNKFSFLIFIVAEGIELLKTS